MTNIAAQRFPDDDPGLDRLSTAERQVMSILERDAVARGDDALARRILERSCGLTSHRAVTAMVRDAAEQPTGLPERVFAASVTGLPLARVRNRASVVSRHRPVRRAERAVIARLRAPIVFAAALALAFVIGGILMQDAMRDPPAENRVANASLDAGVNEAISRVRLLAIPISDGDQDIDDALNDASSIIAFSNLTYSDLESDLAAIDRALAR